MLTRAHEELWAAARDDLRLRIGPGRFDFWLAPLKVVSTDGAEVRLGVPNRVVGDWVETQYAGVIAEVLRERCGAPVEVRLEVDAGLFQEHRRQCADVLGSGTTAGRSVALPPATDDVIRSVGETVAAVGPAPGRDAAKLEETLENFIVGPSNQIAYGAAQQILEAPGMVYNPLVVYGPSGVGKTHLLKGLARAFRGRRARRRDPSGQRHHSSFARVAYVTGEGFFHQYAASVQDGTSRKFRERFRSLDALIVDDVQLLVNKKKTQLEFLHTFNALVDQGRQLVIASDVPPKSLKDLDPGLVGRFRSGLVVAVKRPDYATRLGIVRSRAKRMPVHLDDRALQHLAEHVRRDARELISALLQLDIRAQLAGGSLSYEESREILSEFVRDEKRRIDLRKIRDACAHHFAVPPEALVSRSRERLVSLARQVAMFLGRRYTEKSLADIGKYFGNRDHTTVKCAESKIARLTTDAGDRLSREVRAIVETLEE